MGTSDRPFLANVTLKWVGGKGGMEVAHWVDVSLAFALRSFICSRELAIVYFIEITS